MVLILLTFDGLQFSNVFQRYPLWDRDYDAKSRSCGRRGKLTERKLPK